MNQINPDEAVLNMLRRIVAADLHFHMTWFTGTIDLNTSLADCAGSDVANAVTVLGTSFTLSGVSGHIASLTAPDITFTNATGATRAISAVYVTDTGNSVLLAVAKLDAAITLAPGDSFNWTPKFGDSSRYAA